MPRLAAVPTVVIVSVALVCGAARGVAQQTATAAQPQAPRATLVRDLKIAPNENDLGALIGFYAVTPSGTLAIADYYDFEMSFFDERGKRFANVGREGAGPGEFTGVNGMRGRRANVRGGTVGDTVWVYDWLSRRTTFISASGKFLRTVMLPALSGAWNDATSKAQVSATPHLISFQPIAMMTDGSVLGRGSIAATEAGVRSDGVAYAKPTGVTREDVILMAKDGTTYKTLAVEPPQGVSVTINVRGQPQKFGAPFSAPPQIVTAQDGNRFAILTTQNARGGSTTFTLTVISARGDTLINRTYPFVGKPITAAAASARLAILAKDLRATTPNGPPSRYDDATIAELQKKLRAVMPLTKGAVCGIFIGTDNSVWLALEDDLPEGTHWLVLDEKGNPWREIVTKFSLRSMSRTSVWAQGVDEDDLPVVLRYRIDSGPCRVPACPERIER